MRFAASLSVMVCLFAAGQARAQASAQTFADLNAGDIGAPRYARPEPAHYRLLFGMGGNAGLVNDAPLSILGVATYQLEQSLFGASVISNSSTGGYPRKDFSEFDLLYGYSFGEEVARYERPSQYFHFAVSGGIGFDSYSERWRRFRPDQQMYTLIIPQPNVFEYAIGFPVQVQAIYEPFKYLGAGFLVFANFNHISPNYGAAFTLEARY